MVIIRLLLVFSSITLLVSCSKKKGGGSIITPPSVPTDKNWKFEETATWSDEFDYAGAPDASKWGYDIGGSGWGNNELQYYTNNTDNAIVGGGHLTITARLQDMEGKKYTSARMVTRDKGDFLYGRLEVRAKLPEGKGTWPAIWMLPTDWSYGEWPRSGEIDIMEHVGYDPNKVHFSIHTQAYNHSIGTQKSGTRLIATAMSDFHKYRVDWTPYAIRGYFDDALVFTFVNEGKGFASWPFDKRFHLLLNIAVGGNWGGAQGVDDLVFPATMVVDYVRYYKMIEQ